MQYTNDKPTFIISFLISTLLLSSFSLLKNLDLIKETFLFKLGNERFTMEEFEYYFSKNNTFTKDSVEFKVNEYLDLFIIFKLKVLEAKQRNMHKEKGFINELRSYQKQLIKPYLVGTKVSDSLILEVYERTKEEIKASHILLKVSKDAIPEDTLKAYNKLLKIRSQINAGANFDSLAFAYSEDPSAKHNKGNLGYFSTLAMVYPFENAAFSTPLGSISDIVRTKFGYHLIYVSDRRQARGKIKVAHIILHTKPNATIEELQNIESKINSIHKKITEGENWNKLCNLYSEDINTKNKGGVLNWFGTGELVKEFETVFYNLKNIGDISTPFKTHYGWHIIKLLDKKDIEPLAKIRNKLESKISGTNRFKVKKNQALQTLKKQNNYQLNMTTKELTLSAFDSTLLKGKWKMDSTQFVNQTIFTVQNTSYTTWDFAKFVSENQDKRKNITVIKYIETLYNQFEEKSIFDFEEKYLEQNNKEYRMMLNEYRDGILLFNLMEKEIWGKSLEDSVGLEKFYKDNKQNYKINETADVKIFVSDNKETIEKAKTFINKTKKEIDKAINNKELLNLQIFSKTVERGEDNQVDKYWSKGIFDFNKDNKWYLMQIQAINSGGFKPLNTIKGQVISDYQNYLEELWIKKLKSKYPVKINKTVLKQVIRKIENQL